MAIWGDGVMAIDHCSDGDRPQSGGGQQFSEYRFAPSSPRGIHQKHPILLNTLPLQPIWNGTAPGVVNCHLTERSGSPCLRMAHSTNPSYSQLRDNRPCHLTLLSCALNTCKNKKSAPLAHEIANKASLTNNVSARHAK